MPLFMDFHKKVSATMEEVVKGHIADLAIQEKYKVKYHKYWMNLDAGTVFCLIEGPDKESCEAVHMEAHESTACAIVEVDPAFLNSFMGDGYFVEYGPMLDSSGAIDLGYRHILMAMTWSRNSEEESPKDPGQIRNIIQEHSGRLVSGLSGTLAVFNSADQALRCAKSIRQLLLKEKECRLKIAVCTGQPVTENEDFFGETLQQAEKLCTLAEENQIYISSLTKRLCKEKLPELESREALKTLNESDETFISSWFDHTESNLSEEDFNLDKLCRKMGISRPQLYRKVSALAGRSPNELLRDQRMERAFELLKNKKLNISQVALEVGYTSPSYFTKCFSEKFGCTPSRF